ncbi:hypothetical protein XELAEV_18041113mg [Xenopus laevis]|uniref:Uncharacterized protein n=1 Tax=Xenopus laevis TaxID=8355 RepID=A0A974H580_XENLA|nr:hypothetical protein XELAEV_18041113mg [Xenopus laevis]
MDPLNKTLMNLSVSLPLDSNRLFLKPELKSISQETKILITLKMAFSKKALFSYWLKKESPSVKDITSYLKKL